MIDKKEPKKALSSFALYNQERIRSLKKEKPELHTIDIIKIISAEWTSLSEEKKKPYYEKAEADRQRYEAEKKAYDEQNKANDEQNKANDEQNKAYDE